MGGESARCPKKGDRSREVAPRSIVISCAESGPDVLEESERSPPIVPSRDGAWFRALYRDQFDDVIGLILRFGITRDDAEDIAQRVFLVAYRRYDEIHGFERLDVWLRGVTVRVVREYYRWQRVRRAASWLVELSWAGRVEDERS